MKQTTDIIVSSNEVITGGNVCMSVYILGS